jgi:hypothetical protein
MKVEPWFFELLFSVSRVLMRMNALSVVLAEDKMAG